MSGLLKAIPAALIDGREVSLYELLYTMKVQGDLSEPFHSAIATILILEAARRENIEASSDEVQAESDRLRRALGLHRASDTRWWLKRRMLSEEDFEACAERMVLAEKLKDQVTADGIRPYFEAHRQDFDSVALDDRTTENIRDILWEDWLIRETEGRNAAFTLPSVVDPP